MITHWIDRCISAVQGGKGHSLSPFTSITPEEVRTGARVSCDIVFEFNVSHVQRCVVEYATFGRKGQPVVATTNVRVFRLRPVEFYFRPGKENTLAFT